MSDLTRTEPTAEDDDQPTPRRRRIRPLWLLLVGLVGIFAVVATLVGPTAWAALHAQGAKLTLPDTVADMRRDTTGDASQTATYLSAALAADLALKHTVGAVYVDPQHSSRMILLFGGTGVFVSPGDELDKALGLLNDQTGTVHNLHGVRAGKRGGVMKCGTVSGDGGDIPVCGWADHGTVAVALFPGRSVSDATAIMLPLRESVER